MTPLIAKIRKPSGPSNKAVERARLQHFRLRLPPLKRRALAAALRLQLASFMPPGASYAFFYQQPEQGEAPVWVWLLQSGEDPAMLREQWPEPLLEPAGDGLRLVKRKDGAEAQHWHAGQLRHSRWWRQAPSEQDWERFVRAAGCSTEHSPRPQAELLPQRTQPLGSWLRDDNLPKPDPWVGWRWQVASLALGALLALGLGAHLQTRHQLDKDRALVAQLRAERETALTQRARYQSARTNYEALNALAPKVSQLDLLNSVVSSGVLDPVVAAPHPDSAPPSATPTALGSISAPPAGLTPPPPPAPALSEWDYRNGTLKISLDIPEGELAMLDTTRRIEKLPAFNDVRIGLESSNTNLSLTMRVPAATPAGAKP